MSKQRLSKLQKWTLTRIYERGVMTPWEIREYYGKPIRATYGKGDAPTTAERVAIHKSVKNLLAKGLVKGDFGKDGFLLRLSLTEEGYQQLLKANKSEPLAPFVSFNEYLKRIEGYHKGIERRLSELTDRITNWRK